MISTASASPSHTADLPSQGKAHSPRHGKRPGKRAVGLFIISGLLIGCALGLALASNGVDEDDDLLHYLLSRSSWNDPKLLLHIWGRPGFTVPHAAVAWIGKMPAGFMASRLLTWVSAVGATWFAYRTACKLRLPQPAIVPACLWLMPLYFFQSYTPNTEMMAALYVSSGTYLLACGHRRAAALIFALLPVTRHELAVFLIPLGIYWLWRRDLLAMLLLGWCEFIWNMASWLAHTEIPIGRFFQTHGAGKLGTGNALHYCNRWLEMSGVAIVGLVLVGAVTILSHELSRRNFKRFDAAGHRAKVRLFVVVGALGLVLLHTLLYRFNRFASGGYARFLVPAAPWMAICAACALAPLIKRWDSKVFPRRRASLLFLLLASVGWAATHSTSYLQLNAKWELAVAVTAILYAIWPQRFTSIALLVAVGGTSVAQWRNVVFPHRLGAEQRLIASTIDEMHARYPGHLVTGGSPWVSYFLQEPLDSRRKPPWEQWRLGQPTGMLYLCDATYNDRKSLPQVTIYPHELVAEIRVHPRDPEPYLWVFRRLPGASAPDSSHASPTSQP